MAFPQTATPHDYLAFDFSAVRRRKPISRAEIDAYLKNIEAHPYYAKMATVKDISMLHVDVLMLLRLFARATCGGILEIGPYIGGSSIGIGSGVRDGGGRPYASVEHGGVEEEIGGAYRDHPFYPSSNIIEDLKKNLAAEGLGGFVSIFQGKSDSPSVVEKIFELFRENPIELLFIDADGAVDRDMELFRPLLAKNCLLVFDDYTAPGAEQKEQRVRRVVDEEVARGRLESYGVYGWGTWVGRYRG